MRDDDARRRTSGRTAVPRRTATGAEAPRWPLRSSRKTGSLRHRPRTNRRRGSAGSPRSTGSGRCRTGSPSRASRSPHLLVVAHEGAARFEKHRTSPNRGMSRTRRRQRAGRRVASWKLLRRQELAAVVEDELHGLECERHRHRALECDTRFTRPWRIYREISADGLLDDRHIDLHRYAALSLGADDDLSRLQHGRDHVHLVIEQLLERARRDVRADPARLDEFFEREDVDGILHHARVLEGDRPCPGEGSVQTKLATSERANEGPENTQPDGDVDLAGFLSIEVDAGTCVPADVRCGLVASGHEIRHHAESRQILALAVHELERLRRGTRKAKHAESVAAEKRNGLIRSRHLGKSS